MMRMTGAELTVRLLERQGVRTICGIPGGAILPLYDALSQTDKIHHVLARHEQGAGFMAQGMARVSGQPEVCFASSGPGATNLVTAIADACLDSIPMVAITGQVPQSMIGTDAFQEVDIYGITVPITKHNFLVRSAQELLEVIPDAFRIAMSGRPGPVLVDVPKDVQNEVIEFADFPPPAVPDKAPEIDMDALETAARMINEAERPVLYLGGGVVSSGASSLAITLAEQASMPTTMRRPNMVTRLRVTSRAHIRRTVQPIETKMPLITHQALRAFMKRSITTRTRREPCHASLVRRSRRPSMMRARSLWVWIWQGSGSRAWAATPSS